MTTFIDQKIIDKAYAKQKTFIANKISTLGIAGYKAAVSGKLGQKNMGLKTLLSGVLYAKGELPNNSTIHKGDFKLPKIETEIGYRLKDDISKHTTAENIKDMMAEILPVFEVPDVTAEDPSNIAIPELIVNNTFSSHFVIGEAFDINSVDPNTIEAKLYHNDELMNTGHGKDAMDNQWEALSVAINMAIDHGYTPKKGDIVITGALGQILEIEEGIYTADYGDLGKLKLEVK